MFQTTTPNRAKFPAAFVARRGFTLIELLLVLIILIVLAAIALPKLTGTAERARIDACSAEIHNFTGAMERFNLDMGRFPTNDEGLDALLHNTANSADWRGPYIQLNNVPKDKWGKEYIYRAPGVKNLNGVDISSVGPDGQDGTADDITNWSR